MGRTRATNILTGQAGVAGAVSRHLRSRASRGRRIGGAGPRRGLMPGADTSEVNCSKNRRDQCARQPVDSCACMHAADRAGGLVVDVIGGGPWTAHCRARQHHGWEDTQ
jgi:hypothetical protein